MSELAQTSETIRIAFRWTANGVIVDPSPAPTASIVAPDGTSASLSLTKQGSGSTTRYIADVSKSSAGLYEILAASSDPTVDAAEYQEFVRIGQDWIENVGGGGGGSDPLANDVPGSYAAGTAGAKLGLIGTEGATVPTDDVATGDMTFYVGATYSITDGTAKEISDDYAGDLSSASAQLLFGGTHSLSVTITGAPGAYVYKIEMSETEGTAIGVGTFVNAQLVVILSGGHKMPPRSTGTARFIDVA